MWAVGCCREAVPVSLGISDCLGVACAGIERRPSAFQHAPSARSSARHHRRNESWALRLSIEPQLVRSIHVIEYDKDRRAESGIDMQRFFVSTALLCPRRRAWSGTCRPPRLGTPHSTDAHCPDLSLVSLIATLARDGSRRRHSRVESDGSGCRLFVLVVTIVATA
jgi:hypothetical protein